MSPGLNSLHMKRFFLGLGVGVILVCIGLGIGVAVLIHTPGYAAGTIVEPRLLINHDRIAVRRLVLEPGQSTRRHTHKFEEVVICLEGSKLRSTQPGPEPERETHYPEAGQVFMPKVKGLTHVLTNVGTTRYTQISIELKE